MSRTNMRIDHDYIADQDLVGRYMAGTLPFDERARFEAHFVDCPKCLDALDDVEPFQKALHAFAVEGARATSVTPAMTLVAPPEVVAAPAPAGRWQTWVARAGALAAVAVIAVGAVELARVQRSLARATAEGEIVERQLGESEQRVRELTPRNAGRAEAAASPGALVFPLIKTRGDSSEFPQNRVRLSGNTAWVILVADLDAGSVKNRYRATLDTIAGLKVWSNDQLTASSADSIAVAVPPTVLASGDYVLWLDEQAASSDEWRPAGSYTFRVTQVR